MELCHKWGRPGWYGERLDLGWATGVLEGLQVRIHYVDHLILRLDVAR